MTQFTCKVDKSYRTACADLPEYQGTGYCVLHFPGEEKEEDFKQVLRGKLDYDQKGYDFRGTVFPRGTSNFRARKFGADAMFVGAVFCGEANFSRVKFEGEASFRKATFRDKGDFSEANFEKQGGFRKAIFEKEADFSHTVFKGEAKFRRTTFKGFVEFKAPSDEKPCKHYTFKGRANFSAAKFEERATFVGRCTFDIEQKKATFRDALIEKPENFSLDGVALRPSWFIDTNVQGFRFTNVKWLPLENRRKGALDAEVDAIGVRRGVNTQDKEQRKDHLGVLARTCRELSTNAEDNRDYLTANEFHYLSMEAVRKQGWSRSWPITFLYWVMSGYGVRAARAFFVLLGICVAFAAFYTLLGPTELDNFWTALGYSLGALARLNPNPRPNPGDDPMLFQYLVIVEGLLGPLQIALLVLAVRRKVMR
jgi:uncharacterized protein YjbI with pentapeptide repeats